MFFSQEFKQIHLCGAIITLIRFKLPNDSVKLTMGLVQRPCSMHVHVGWNGALQISDV